MPTLEANATETPLTFKEMQEEVYSRGFDDLEGDAASEARVKRWLNIAQREITDFKPWPFLQSEEEVNLPASNASFGHITNIVDIANRNELRFADRRELVANDPTLEASGNAERWWMENGSLKVYPETNTGPYIVYYTQIPPEMVEDSDTPIVPGNFNWLIVEGAVIRAYKNRDAYSAARLVREEWSLGVEQMVKVFMKENYDKERRIVRTGRFASDYF